MPHLTPRSPSPMAVTVTPNHSHLPPPGPGLRRPPCCGNGIPSDTRPADPPTRSRHPTTPLLTSKKQARSNSKFFLHVYELQLCLIWHKCLFIWHKCFFYGDVKRVPPPDNQTTKTHFFAYHHHSLLPSHFLCMSTKLFISFPLPSHIDKTISHRSLQFFPSTIFL